MQLDPTTLLITEAIGSLMSFMVLWQAAGSAGADARSLRSGALSMLSLVVSCVLLASRDVAPPLLYMFAANIAVLSCGLFAVHTFRAFNGRAGVDRRSVVVWAAAVLAFVFVFALGDFEQHYRARATIITVGLAGLFSISLAELVRDRSLRHEPSRKFMLLLLTLAVLSLVARLVVLRLASPTTGDLLAPGLERSLTLLPAVLVATGFGMALLLMHHGRLTAVALDLAARDPLTRLPNRRALVSHLQRSLHTARDEGRPTSLLLLDIDHFKRINDTFGHQAGDEVLCRFADCVREQLRPGDFLARIGGEEFCVVLVDCTTSQAQESAARLCEAVSRHPCELSDGRTLHLTVSIGVTGTEGRLDSDWDALHVRADEALYVAKSAGRNRAMTWFASA